MATKRVKQAVDARAKNFLTEAEIKRFLDAARRGRHGTRDYLLMLMTYRHGLRVSELVDVRLKDLDLETLGRECLCDDQLQLQRAGRGERDQPAGARPQLEL